jgi:hypothetical protein
MICTELEFKGRHVREIRKGFNTTIGLIFTGLSKKGGLKKAVRVPEPVSTVSGCRDPHEVQEAA